MFSRTDDNRTKFFANRRGSDYFIFQKKDDKWILNLIELKKTVTEKTWGTAKEQMASSYFHGVAFSKILGIDEFECKFITVHSGEKFRELKETTNFNALKFERLGKSEIDDWQNDYIIIEDYTGESKKYVHRNEKLETVFVDGKEIFKGVLDLNK